MTVRFTRSESAPQIPESVFRDLVDAVGKENVLTDEDALTEAGRDWWPITLVWVHRGNQPALSQAVVRPGSPQQVAAVLEVANVARIPVTPFAGRSGVCGGSLPVVGGISLDLRRLDTIFDIDAHDLIVHTGAGVYGPDLQRAVEAEALTIGHFPQSFDISTVGGWIACRGAGQYSNRYGKIEDIVLGLEVVLADGTVLRTNPQPGAATGPDLQRVFVGAEGTLGVITSAWLQVRPSPSATAARAWSFTSFQETLEAQRRVARRDGLPAVFRAYDQYDSALHFELKDGRSMLVVLAEGEPGEVGYQMDVVENVVESFGDAVREEDESHVEHWLATRNDVSQLDEVISRGIVVDTIEIAAPWSKLPAIYSAVRTGILDVDTSLAAMAHASHAYRSGGCLYFTFAGAPGDDPTTQDSYYNDCWDAAMRAVIDGGGTISHHHGIGVNRARFLEEELGAAGLGVLRHLKQALDPAGILNPGKLALGPEVWPLE